MYVGQEHFMDKVHIEQSKLFSTEDQSFSLDSVVVDAPVIVKPL